jgi:hypothetical protein
MTSHQILGYVLLIPASLLFMFVGLMLLLAPARFSRWMRAWARVIHFSQISSGESSDVSARTRVPGFAVFCFGAFIFYKVLRSLLIELSIFQPSGFANPLPQGMHSRMQYVAALVPILFGATLLVRLDAIHEAVSKSRSAPDGQAPRSEPAIRLFKVIAFTAILAGIATLFRILLRL